MGPGRKLGPKSCQPSISASRLAVSIPECQWLTVFGSNCGNKTSPRYAHIRKPLYARITKALRRQPRILARRGDTFFAAVIAIVLGMMLVG